MSNSISGWDDWQSYKGAKDASRDATEDCRRAANRWRQKQSSQVIKNKTILRLKYLLNCKESWKKPKIWKPQTDKFCISTANKKTL